MLVYREGGRGIAHIGRKGHCEYPSGLVGCKVSIQIVFLPSKKKGNVKHNYQKLVLISLLGLRTR